jgi:ketosteroid isomerase-like protein
MTRFFSLAILLLLSNASVPAGPKDPPADSSVLLKADEAFDAATAAEGLKGFASFLADEVATLRPDKPIVEGKDAMTALWTPLLSNPDLVIRWKPLEASISAKGDLGYTLGAYEITSKGEQAKHVVATGKYVTIWRKQRDGSWRVVFDSGVPDAPAKDNPS